MDFESGLVATKPVALVGTFVALSLFYIAWKIIYNLYLHPLHHIPGPKFSAISRLPYIHSRLTFTAHDYVLKLHEKYGHVVRITPNEVSFTSGETAWPEIYGFRTGKLRGHENMAKDKGWYAKPVNGFPSILAADDAAHSRGRRILSHAFSATALAEQEGLVQAYVDQLISGLKETLTTEAGAPQDMAKWYNWTTFDVIADLLFGEPFGSLQDKATHKHIDTQLRALDAGHIFYIMTYWPWTKALGGLIIDQKAMADRMEYYHWTKSQVEKRAARETQRPDFMTHILKHNATGKDKGMGLNDQELVTNAQLFITAGSETTATMLSGTTYMLCKTPTVLTKLQSEVRAAFSSYGEITLAGVSKLPYLFAVIEEGLRYFPPVPAGFERTVGKGGEVVSGVFIPENTGVCVSQIAAYHSPENFRNPLKFAPERWMGDEEYKDDKRNAYQPFSFGPRNCLGKNLAYAEMKLILAKMVWSFDLSLDAKSEDWMDRCKVSTLWKKPELAVHLKEVVRD